MAKIIVKKSNPLKGSVRIEKKKKCCITNNSSNIISKRKIST